MKIIYDNIIYSLQKAGGISLYWSELIKRILEKKNTTFYEIENDNLFKKELDFFEKKESILPLKILRYLPFMKKVSNKSIFHSSYYRVSLQKEIINITTVHDFTYEYFKKGLPRYIHLFQKSFAIRKSDGIICVSENTKKDLLKFYPTIEESKVKVIYNGVGDEFMQIENPKSYLENEFNMLIGKTYILYIGDRSSYKNFNIVIKILQKMINYELVVVGGQEFSDNEKKDMADIISKVYHFRGIDGYKLNILYNNAFCLLYPSSYEGFGIPIAEAMKSGCPVVSTKLSSIPEVAGDAGLLVDNINVEDFINKIKKLEDYEDRTKFIKKGLFQSRKFSWDKCFNETFEFYSEIWNKK